MKPGAHGSSLYGAMLGRQHSSRRQGFVRMHRWAPTTVRVAVALIVTLAGLCFIPPAGAATTWVRVAAPSPSPVSNVLASVSCQFGGQCTAVGSYVGNDGRTKPLIVHTADGVSWTRVPITNPRPTAPTTKLLSVSCYRTECAAVGFSGNGPDDLHTFVMWTGNGSTWRYVPTTNQGGLPAYLTGVSCQGNQSCWAVGQVANRTLILRTTDSVNWFRQPSPNPGAGVSHLNAVSCVEFVRCSAVGYITSNTPGARQRTLVLRTTDGKIWTQIPSLNPNPQYTDSHLDAVFCWRTSWCYAVGSAFARPGNVHRGFILRTINGTTWRRQPTPVEGGDVALSGVSCEALKVCTAVGTKYGPNLTDPAPTLLQTTDGITWTESPSRYTAGAVSCVYPSSCSCRRELDAREHDPIRGRAGPEPHPPRDLARDGSSRRAPRSRSANS